MEMKKNCTLRLYSISPSSSHSNFSYNLFKFIYFYAFASVCFFVYQQVLPTQNFSNRKMKFLLKKNTTYLYFIHNIYYFNILDIWYIFIKFVGTNGIFYTYEYMYLHKTHNIFKFFWKCQLCWRSICYTFKKKMFKI